MGIEENFERLIYHIGGPSTARLVRLIIEKAPLVLCRNRGCERVLFVLVFLFVRDFLWYGHLLGKLQYGLLDGNQGLDGVFFVVKFSVHAGVAERK